jgi:NADPH:quinone reductase-like Zn-dependent oxidoreductase
VQFAKAKGAKVYATAADDGLAFVEALGADVVIDYKNQDFAAMARQVDVVFDLIGGTTQERSWEVVKDGGALISTIAEPSRERAQARGVRVARYTAQPNAGQLAEIGRLIDAGQVKVHVSEIFHFADTVEAERRLEAGHVRGKIVLDLALEGQATAG